MHELVHPLVRDTEDDRDVPQGEAVVLQRDSDRPAERERAGLLHLGLGAQRGGLFERARQGWFELGTDDHGDVVLIDLGDEGDRFTLGIGSEVEPTDLRDRAGELVVLLELLEERPSGAVGDLGVPSDGAPSRPDDDPGVALSTALDSSTQATETKRDDDAALARCGAANE
nr:hypothetical protein [Curtobacterium sp. MCLR17_040]